ncbi:MAG: SufD family Fe-S cluster assembly protein [Pseudomonadota bacterium]
MALPEAKRTATEARLAALELPEGAGWARTARAAALERVNSMGLPGRRDEYWKYTRPDALVVPDAPSAPVAAPEDPALFSEVERLRLVFVDGVFDPEQSDDPTLAGVVIERLALEQTHDIHWAKDLYGVLEAKGQVPVERPLAALNSAYASDGVLIHVTGDAPKPVSLVYQQSRDTSDAILHHCIKIEAGASFTLLEDGPVAARYNTVMEVEVPDGAAFNHIRTQGRDHDRAALTHIFARLGTESQFKSFTLTANGVLTRNECVLELTGDDASAHVAGAALGDGDFQHDDTVFITHDAVNCESRQVFKKVLRNGATGVFQGKILVKEGAQKTDGYQISQSLLLDDDSQFYAKPELEIYADDVQCSHGSTSGAIDETALFYLRARGVPLGQAQDLMTLAFLAEAIEEIADEALADVIRACLDDWLSRRRER